MSKVELTKIRALTFYKGEETAYRRTSPLPQLTCIGKPCSLFQPEVVRCESLGGSGVDVDWKCDADLPESLRFGKVVVNCEGWSRPGDPYVLKGSCSLEYRLVQVPGSLLRTDSPVFNVKGYNWSAIAFNALWIGFSIILLYSFFKSCFRNANTPPRAPPRSGNNPRPNSGSGSGWFPGGYRDDHRSPPPPYTKTDQNSTSQGGWQPGFWTGAFLGGLANHVWNRNTDQQAPQRQSYDWERFRSQPQSSIFGTSNSRQTRRNEDDDRGEGTSNLGAMRRSTGIGGSNVR